MVMNFYRTKLYAQARAQGYRQSNPAGNIILFLLLVWGVTWAIPTMFIIETMNKGFIYAYNDATSSIGVGIFVGLCFLAAGWQIVWAVKILFGKGQ